METLGQLGEQEIIRRLTQGLPSHPGVIVGAGDDCAVVQSGDPAQDLLLKVDAVIEGRHFTRETAPEKIGHKSVGRVLSDIAAMGGEPEHLLVSLVAPQDAGFDRVKQIYAGASALAARAGASLVGGGTASGPALELHVFGTGRAPHGKALLRSGARPGDIVLVTGELGGSAAGKHLDFDPRLREGRWLRESAFVTSMIDISDGLVTDLQHIADASGAGATLLEDSVPVSAAARAMRDDRTPLDHALYDGEDYELLFTVPEEKKAAFLAAWASSFKLPCTAIGYMTAKAGKVVLLNRDGASMTLHGGGFDHFAASP
jgi:thiamine-monophosphate kinase